ncbi:hypothetical protein JJJ17_15485 [Paracoccus caeni]|uniref:Uncharacterized protein n=1 Tax=Paracoccus caeni TaxID=657651 RepID=A0A934SGA6_9RHOB|nr:hypothetical protein [Paracoccus caeni]MBK4217332.1 hypothetical protein [Paracoccus caeni]
MKGILNPTTPEAMEQVLDRPQYLRQLGVIFLLSLPLPLTIEVASRVIHQSSVPVEISVYAVCGFVLLLPLVLYASMRLNVVIIARERAMFGPGEPRLHAPFHGPLMIRRSPFTGSTRSRFAMGLPWTSGLMVFFSQAFRATDGGFSIVVLAVVLMVIAQVALLIRLLGDP